VLDICWTPWRSPAVQMEVEPPTKRKWTVKGVTIEVDARYEVVRRLGAGAFGMVFEAKDALTSARCAIKRVANAFEDEVACKKALREIKMMRHFEHENILGLRDIMLPADDGTWKDLVLVCDLMDSDLHYIIHSKQALSDGHVQWFVYQMMRGLKAIHSANAIHRDLKPSNLLVNKNSDLKICDFGLARPVIEDDPHSPGARQQELTEYVVTRWYRAPELIAQAPSYGQAVDLWSAGCILAECLGRSVLLKGRDYLHQMRLIVELLGTPTASDFDALRNPMAAEYIQACPARQPTPLGSLYPGAPPSALDLLSQLLVFDPKRRMGVAAALSHPYLLELHQMNDAPDSPPIDANAAEEQPGVGESDLKGLVWAELQKLHPEVGPCPPSFAAGASPARVMDLSL